MNVAPRCVVTDLDRTLTGADLALDPRALARIRDLRAAGIRVVIATGRRFDELEARGLLAEADGIVAENGAVICVPRESVFQVLHPDFASAARAALADIAGSFHWGRVGGSGPRVMFPWATARLAVANVAHAIEFNADEVMLLPPGVSKASGAELCLARLGLAPSEAWAIGDGENDASMLRWAGLGAAPANAAPEALAAADVALAASYADAFLELTEPLARAPVAR